MGCSQCGVCCKLFLINLNKEEYLSEKYQTVFDEFGLVEFEEAELTGANILKRALERPIRQIAEKLLVFVL